MSDVPFDDADGDPLPRSDRLQILSPEEYELLYRVHSQHEQEIRDECSRLVGNAASQGRL